MSSIILSSIMDTIAIATWPLQNAGTSVPRLMVVDILYIAQMMVIDAVCMIWSWQETRRHITMEHAAHIIKKVFFPPNYKVVSSLKILFMQALFLIIMNATWIFRYPPNILWRAMSVWIRWIWQLLRSGSYFWIRLPARMCLFIELCSVCIRYL